MAIRPKGDIYANANCAVPGDPNCGSVIKGAIWRRSMCSSQVSLDLAHAAFGLDNAVDRDRTDAEGVGDQPLGGQPTTDETSDAATSGALVGGGMAVEGVEGK